MFDKVQENFRLKTNELEETPCVFYKNYIKNMKQYFFLLLYFSSIELIIGNFL